MATHEPVAPGKSVEVTVILPPYLAKWLTEAAAANGLAKSAYIRAVLIRARRGTA